MFASSSLESINATQGVAAPTVLVVEDQVLLRLYVSEMIEQAGYTVIAAEDADEALVVLRKNPQIRAVFSDFEMPSTMTGLELGHHLSRTRPDVAFVLTSGRKAPGSFALPPRSLFVSKPFLESDVCAALAQLVH
ncbi:response regulator [Asaia sp. As-1742]|uniref:response regulator n=1 Tax=Asaia sp. As-1742 TaxID=2608325 RepID=UPI0014208FD7|nr:response regulator [Asaia sp. As-1742]NIE79069.1 response regulator [Asaia sp. As-1742]